MGKYDGLSEQERRKLYEDFSRAAREIRVTPPPQPAAQGEEGPVQGLQQEAGPSAVPTGSLKELAYGRRPPWILRVRIDRYACSRGYEICSLAKFISSFFSFLYPHRDRAPKRFVKLLVQDSPYQPGPSGYSLSRTLVEIKRHADFLARGDAFLLRNTDRSLGFRGELGQDLLAWEPFGARLLALYSALDVAALEVLEAVKQQVESQQAVNVYTLAEVVKALYRRVLQVDAPFEAVKGSLDNVGELIKALYKRIYTDKRKLRQVCTRIDTTVQEFLNCYTRIRWFTSELYPVLLKLLGIFREREDVAWIADRIAQFTGLDPRSVLRPEAPPTRGPEGLGAQAPQPPPEAAAPRPPAEEEYRGILTILSHSFPGSGIERIVQGDYTSLAWFQQRLFTAREHRPLAAARRPDSSQMLLKLGLEDPLAPVILLHRLIADMLEAVDIEALSWIADPLKARPSRVRETLKEIFEQWQEVGERLLTRYLQEIDYYEREVSLVEERAPQRFEETVAGRREVEMINQCRNHAVRDYGHVALVLERKQYFNCRPLYALAQELCQLLARLAGDRSQLAQANPVPASRWERADFLRSSESPVLRQIQAYIEALPAEKQLLADGKADSQRTFLEILFGLADLLSFLLNDPDSPLREAGGRVMVAGKEEEALRERIARDQGSLRVELKKDFEETDRLTGLVSKNEYLRLIPGLYGDLRAKAESLSFLVIDIDHFKVVNDARGHEFGDQVLRAVAQVVLASMRAEDLAVRFGGEEILVLLRGDCAAGMAQAERMRRKCREQLSARFGQALAEIPAAMVEKELQACRVQDPQAAPSLEELVGRWQRVPIASLSLGVAQGVGRTLKVPSADEKELFRRADRMLYLAKESGRDRVVGWVDELKLPLLYGEYAELRAFAASGKGGEPADFIRAREAAGKPLAFKDYREEGESAPEQIPPGA